MLSQMSNAINKGTTPLFSPRKLDLSKRTYGDAFTADDLHYVRARDARVRYAIDTRVNDAFRNGLTVKNKAHREIVQENTPIVRRASKWMLEFGWSLVIHLGDGDDDAAALARAMSPDQQSRAFMAWHPYVQDLGGVQFWELDKATGRPTTFYIRVPNSDASYTIDASRCDIYTHGDYSNHWQGLSDLAAGLDPIIGMRMWEGTAIRRARDYSTVRYVIPLPPNCFDSRTGEPLAAVKALADQAFTDVPYLLVPAGAGMVDRVGGPIDPNEGILVMETIKESIATSMSIAKTDVTGGEAGHKLSADANEGIYSMTMKDIQMELYPFIRDTFRRMGVEVTGFRTAAELPPAQKYTVLGSLVGLFNISPPSIKEAVALLIDNFFEGEFGMDIEVDPNDDVTLPGEGGADPRGDDAQTTKQEKKGGWFKRERDKGKDRDKG